MEHYADDASEHPPHLVIGHVLGVDITTRILYDNGSGRAWEPAKSCYRPDKHVPNVVLVEHTEQRPELGRPRFLPVPCHRNFSAHLNISNNRLADRWDA